MTRPASGLDVSPRVLVWARTTSGLSVPDVLQRTGVSETQLREYETGASCPSLSKLEAIAEAYHRSLATFLLDAPPSEPPMPTDLRVVARGSKPPAFTETTVLAVRRARRIQRIASDLGQEHRPSLLAQLQREIDGAPADVSALRVVKSTGAYEGEPPRFQNPYRALSHWKQVIEGQGVAVLQFPMPVEEVRGFTLAEGALPAVVINQRDAPRARTFTLLHEFGHLLRKRPGICDLGTEGSHRGAPQIEVWCNAFAGAFLVPAQSLVPLADSWPSDEPPPSEGIRMLSYRYQVSEDVILRRLLSLGRITASLYADEIAERRSRWGGDKSKKPAKVMRNIPAERLSEYGAPFVSLVLRRASEGRISLGDVADILDIRLKHLPAISDRLARAASGM